jgi:hypothetical protein
MIMLLGDTHGNLKFILNVVIPAAIEKGVKWIYQVGDFGYWEHESAGVDFLDEVNKSLSANSINLVFIKGNHDKVSLIEEKYPLLDGFHLVRSSIWYAPDGTVWSPDAGKTNFIALGGAYSVDKPWRLKQERYRAEMSFSPSIANMYSNPFSQTLWFPEEEMTDADMDDIISSVTERIDVILAHDKPSSSTVPIKLHPIAECLPNQVRLQKAVIALKPKLYVHGHFHVRYTDMIRSGDNNTYTKVEGLGADVSRDQSSAWEFLTL